VLSFSTGILRPRALSFSTGVYTLSDFEVEILESVEIPVAFG